MKKRVADIVTDVLVENGINTCFSVVGGGAMHLNNAFVMKKKLKKIYNHHEQACAMAAEGYARASGKMAAVCVTSGPGGTNAINGVQGAWVDSIPMIVISGFPRYETSAKATDLDIRCRGVQENDIIGMVKNITKYAKFIENPLEIKQEMQYAIDIALDGRRGPVWIDIPLNIQAMLVEEEDLYKNHIFTQTTDKNLEDEILDLKNELSFAKRPCILTGSGIRTSGSIELFRKFAKAVKIPIVGGSLQADVCYNGQERYFGMSGSSGPRCGNFILQNADLILVLGNSLSFKQTGFNQEGFAPKAKIIMVDIQYDESLKSGLHIEKCICTDLKEFFGVATRILNGIDVDIKWIQYCENVKKKFPSFEMLNRHGSFNNSEKIPALYFWKVFLNQSKDDAVIALGNSSCIGGILQEGVKSREQRVLVNYNCGSMGHDLPNAIGGCLGLNREVVCVTGDGSIMMNLQELQTIRQYNLPIKIVVFSNDGYGAIRNTCSKFFNGVYTGCDDKSGVSFPEFCDVAKTFGFDYKCCNNLGELESSIEWLNSKDTYCILEIKERLQEISGPGIVSTMNEEGVFETPPLHVMTPLLEKEELESLMIKDCDD